MTEPQPQQHSQTTGNNDPERLLTTLPQAGFMRHVNAAFKNYHSVLALGHSPLAQSSLSRPLLILDEVSPDADKRGRALRLALRWAVDHLAPEPTVYPIGSERPYEDPTWQDPRWWRYNILRHRYVEPLHPDEFVEGGRFTETLIALTGIPNSDIFFDERNRAIKEVAQRLRQQLITHKADENLRQLALQEVFKPLHANPTGLALLDIAATFDSVFPRDLLLQIGANERLMDTPAALHVLTTFRLLQIEDEGEALWLSPVLQTYLYARQRRDHLRRRHRQAALYFGSRLEPLAAAAHWHRANQPARSAEVLLEAATELINELQVLELGEALQKFKEIQLAPAQWQDVQILLSDICFQSGRYDEAIAACRLALRVTPPPAPTGGSQTRGQAVSQQARIYRRMGKLYEKRNQRHALAYYKQAAERFDVSDAERIELLKDRGWLYILRKEWAQAEADLTEALAATPETAVTIQADIYDALASLNRKQKRYDPAIQFAQKALSLREESGNLPRIADSFINLGILYSALAEYDQAIAAYEEALQTYERQGNRERTATAVMNIGMAHHLDGRLQQAVSFYHQGLQLCQQIGLPHTEAKAYYNLAEALAELGQVDEARRHWQRGYALSQKAQFDDQVAFFLELRGNMLALQGIELAHEGEKEEVVGETAVSTLITQPEEPAPPQPAPLTADERLALDIARREGQVAPRPFMLAAGVSKATASRRLARLVAAGFLAKHGRGRGTYYVLTQTAAVSMNNTAPPFEHTLDWSQIKEVLLRHKSELIAQYGINQLGVAHLPGRDAGGTAGTPVAASPVVAAVARPDCRLDLLVRFATPPTIFVFFDLENRLRELLEIPVDLKPTEQDVPHAVWGKSRSLGGSSTLGR